MNLYEPKYTGSKALLIGINKYQKIAPLSYAVNDAQGLKTTLTERFDFRSEDVVVLLDTDATKENIMRTFLRFADGASASDDRIVFFFAGHGHTRTGCRQEVGFLVPVDGDIDDLASLIRWDDLTRNAELIPAKHILFIMDACYGGLALTRSHPAGSMRFLKDMVQRLSRQVITAGKADETVADAGGPLPGHSVFTGHLLEGMAGKAKTQDGILTASGIMSYVYEHVSKDPDSHQTPHYGFLDGDGDFVFAGLPIASDDDLSEVDKDVLVTLPSSSQGGDAATDDMPSLVVKVKEMLSEKRYTIQLHDVLIRELRGYLALNADDFFAVQGQWNEEAFRARIKRYETVTERLQKIAICISYWGQAEHQAMLEKTICRMTDCLESQAGLAMWSQLRWYPLLLLTYSSGIAAISAGKYEQFRTICDAQVKPYRPSSQSERSPLVEVLTEVLGEGNVNSAFKSIPGHERNHVPQSEYLFKLLQPIMDDLLFLGDDYERWFDRFEVLWALVCADRLMDERGGAWGPFGRFAYKFRGRSGGNNPFNCILEEAKSQQNKWPALKVGLFRGSYTRFSDVAAAYMKNMASLNWH